MADIVIFDEKEVRDVSTYEKPHAYSTGFRYVLVNGETVVEEGKHNGTRSGKTLSPIQNRECSNFVTSRVSPLALFDA
jgi:N-acyl-D-aspartate/D-glutamate deacylase